MATIALALVDRKLFCSIPGCQTELPFDGNKVLGHYRKNHVGITVSRTIVSSRMTNLGLSILGKDGSNITCQLCESNLPDATTGSIQNHLRLYHGLRINSKSEIIAFIQGTEETGGIASVVPRSIFAVHCPHQACDFASPFEADGKEAALKFLHAHVKKQHGASDFDDSVTLLQRVRCAPVGEGVFTGKRLKKSHPPISTSTSASTLPTSTTTLPTSTTTLPTSTSTLPTSSSHTSDSSLVGLSLQPMTDTLQAPAVYSASTGRPHSFRDDYFGKILTGKRVAFICRADIRLPPGLMLSDAAIGEANSATDLFMKLSWWVTESWYATMCKEGALEWYHTLTDYSQECASAETIFAATKALIRYGLVCADRGKMFHPGVANGMPFSPTESFGMYGEEQDAIVAAVGPRYSMTNIMDSTQDRYAHELVPVLNFLNNLSVKSTGYPLMGTDWNNNTPELNAGNLVQILIQMEWPEGVSNSRMGMLSQAVAASALKDGRSPSTVSGHSSSSDPEPIELKDIRLVAGSRLAATCSAVMYVIKCLIVINRLEDEPFAPTAQVVFQSSRSGPQLAALKSDYDHSPTTHKAFEDLFSYDVVESFNRGRTPVVRLKPANGGQGVYHIGTREISAAVTQATSSSFEKVRQLLALIGLPQSITRLLSIAHQNISFMPMKDIIGHFVANGISQRDLQEISVADLGVVVTDAVKSWLLQNPASRDDILARLHELQDLIIFLVHIVSGGPGRAQDVLDIMLVHTPTMGHISAITEINFKIDAIVHKASDVQHSASKTISRFPNYSTAKLISIFVAFSQGVYGDNRRLWLPSVRNDTELIKCFERAASQCFRLPLHFNWWRHIVQMLVARGYQELNAIEASVDVPGSQPLLSIQQETTLSSAAPSVSNRLTLQFGHSVTTAAINYGTKLMSPSDWQMASISYQNYFQFENSADIVRSAVGSGLQCRVSLFPVEAETDEEQMQFITGLLKEAYPKSTGPRNDIQSMFLKGILAGTTDVIVVGGCGTGKSAAFLVPALALCHENSGRCLLLLCPQNNVAMSAALLCKSSALRYHLFENNQETKDIVEQLYASDGHSLPAPIIIVTFVTASDSALFNDFVHIMIKTNRLARVVVDEVHISLSSFSWRSCFSNCGNLRARLGYHVPWSFTTATLPLAAMQPYLSFWHCGIRPTTVVRSPTILPVSVSYSVIHYEYAAQALSGIKLLLNELFGGEKWSARRCLVLTLSIDAARKLSQMLEGARAEINLSGDESIAVVTSETATAEMLDAVKNARVIVCTTVISSSMNIPRLDAVIVFKSCYSLADLVQAWGRAGRDGQPARCYLIWCKGSHKGMFPDGSMAPELSSLGWLRPRDRTVELHLTFSPSGVLSFADNRNLCRRIQIFTAFDGESEDSKKPENCLTLRESKLANDLCDNCLKVTGVQDDSFGSISPSAVRSLDEDFSDDFDDEEDGKNTYSKPMEEPEPGDEGDNSNDIDHPDDSVVAPLLDRAHDPLNEQVIEIYRVVATIFDEREAHGLLDACFMCDGKDCNGLKEEIGGYQRCCPGRKAISSATWNYMCFGCGGNHKGAECQFRKIGCAANVPSGIGRCFKCYMPQQVISGSSFHSGVARLSGRSDFCLKRGKAMFGLLAASAHLKKEVMAQFQRRGMSLLCDPPEALVSSDKGEGFSAFWDWLFEYALIRHSVRNIDVWIYLLLTLLKEMK